VGPPTANLLIAVLTQGFLLGAAFPTSGIPRLPQANPAVLQVVSNTLPPVLPPISTSQLIQGSIQISNFQLMRQKQPLQTLNGGIVPLPNAATPPQQRQSIPHGVAMLALGNRAPIFGGNGTGPSNMGSFGEGMDYRWSGTVMWQGVEKKELRVQITATAFIGNPYALSHGISVR
jgi:hypothetical protein